MTLREKFRLAKHLLDELPTQTGGWTLVEQGRVTLEITSGDGMSSHTTSLSKHDIDLMLSLLPATNP